MAYADVGAAEVSVVGACLLDEKAVGVVVGMLDAGCFSDARHKLIFDAIARLHGRGDPVDEISVMAELQRAGSLADAGDALYLAHLTGAVPATANVLTYARIVRDAADRRKLAGIGRWLTTEADSGKSPADVRDALLERTGDIGYKPEQDALSPGEAIKVALDRKPEVFHFGVPVVDRLIDGVVLGSTVIIGGWPSTGKTALGLQLALGLAKQNIPVSFLSAEMSLSALGLRIASQEGRVDSVKLRGRNMDGDEARRLSDAWSALNDAPMRCAGVLAATPQGVLTQADREFRTSRFVFLDYLQLVRGSGERREDIDMLSAGFKALAVRHNGVAILLSQLRRLPPGTTHKPTAQDLKESSGLEQDADVILLLHRPESDDAMRTGPVRKIEMLVAKNRNGRAVVGTTAAFHCAFTRFELLEERDRSGGGATGAGQ